MTDSKTAHWLPVLILGVTVLLTLGAFLRSELAITQGRLGVPLDDAWIHYQFARNMSQGAGFSYNPGEPTPGSTAPLWTLLLAAVALLTEELLVPSLILSALFLLLSVWLVYGLTYDLTGHRWTALAAGVATALTGRLLWVGLAGMETTAFTAVTLAAVWLFTRRGLSPVTALLFALASQLRPEGHVLFLLAAGFAAWQQVRSREHNWRNLLRQMGQAGLIYVLINAPYALFSLWTTGNPLPNTFYAKVGTEHFFSWRTLRETVVLHWRDNPVSLLLALAGLVPLWRRSRLAAAWLVLLPILTAVIVDFVWHHGRYTMPLIPFQMIAAALFINWLHQRLDGIGVTPRHRAIAVVVLAAALALGGVWRLPRWASFLGHNAKEIMAIDEEIGRWLRQQTATDALVAVDDIGAIAYLSERRIFDLNGLVTPQMWPAMREGGSSPTAVRLMAEAGVTHLAIFPDWHRGLVETPGLMQPLQEWRVETETIIGRPHAVVYAVNWPYRQEVTPETAVSYMLGDAISLIGYDFAPPADTGSFTLTLYWRCEQPPAHRYKLFVHVLGEGGEIVAQSDREPFWGLAPTHLWQPGDLVRDPVPVTLPPDLPGQAYTVSVGLYEEESGARLPVMGDTPLDNDAIPLVAFRP